MDNFKAVYKNLTALEKAMDYVESDMTAISTKRPDVSRESMKDVLDDRFTIPENIMSMSQTEIQAQIKEIEAKRPVIKKDATKSIVIGTTKFHFI